MTFWPASDIKRLSCQKMQVWLDLNKHVMYFRQCETVVPLEDPIITECTSTLQEWGVLWKQLYVVQSSMITLKSTNRVSHPKCVRLCVHVCVCACVRVWVVSVWRNLGCPGNNELCNLSLLSLSRKWALGSAAIKQLLFKRD